MSTKSFIEQINEARTFINRSYVRRTANVDAIKLFYKDELNSELNVLATQINAIAHSDFTSKIPDVFTITLNNSDICNNNSILTVYDKLETVYDNMFRVYAISKHNDGVVMNLDFTVMNYASINCDKSCIHYPTSTGNKEDFVNYDAKELQADMIFINNLFVTAISELLNEQGLELIGDIKLTYNGHVSRGIASISYVKAKEFLLSFSFRIKQN